MISKNKAILRVDGSFKTGMGHVMRSICLVKDILTPCGVEPVFILKGDLTAEQRLKQEGFSVHFLPEDTSGEIELKTVSNIVEIIDPVIFFTDLPIINNRKKYQDFINKANIYHIVFDDLLLSRIEGNIIINSSIYKDNNDTKKNRLVKYLEGPDYVLINKHFQQSQKAGISENKNIPSITISFGGSDPKGFTEKTLQSALRVKAMLHINIVLGSAAKNISFEEIIVPKDKSISIYRNISNIADLLSSSVVAVISGGITLYETAFLGVPSIILCQNKKQNMAATEFDNRGVSVNLGWKGISPKKIIIVIEELLQDSDKRKKMSKSGRKLVDGKGVDRIRLEIQNLLRN